MLGEFDGRLGGEQPRGLDVHSEFETAWVILISGCTLDICCNGTT